MKMNNVLERSQNSEKRILASSCLSVHISVRIEQLVCHWTDRHESFNECFFFRKFLQKIQFSLKPDKCKGYSAWIPIYIFVHISLNSSTNANVAEEIRRQKLNTCTKLN